MEYVGLKLQVQLLLLWGQRVPNVNVLRLFVFESAAHLAGTDRQTDGQTR